MRALVQRVLQANVEVNQETVGQIGPGLLVYLGVEDGDGLDDFTWILEKVVKLRIFPDQQEKMTFPVTDIAGGILVVSQFTLCADLSKGNRPSFKPAADPDTAKEMYLKFIKGIAGKGIAVQSGIFGSYMMVSSVNDGPVTILLDSRSKAM